MSRRMQTLKFACRQGASPLRTQAAWIQLSCMSTLDNSGRFKQRRNYNTSEKRKTQEAPLKRARLADAGYQPNKISRRRELRTLAGRRRSRNIGSYPLYPINRRNLKFIQYNMRKENIKVLILFLKSEEVWNIDILAIQETWFNITDKSIYNPIYSKFYLVY